MESRYFFRKQLTGVLITTAAAFIMRTPALLASVADDARFETSTFMQKTLYRRPEHVATDINPSGAESPINIRWDQTHTGKWYIEQQRYGSDAVCAGSPKKTPPPSSAA
jgi:hypothetical protein